MTTLSGTSSILALSTPTILTSMKPLEKYHLRGPWTERYVFLIHWLIQIRCMHPMTARDLAVLPISSMQALAPTNEPLLLFVRVTDDMDHDTEDPVQEIRVFLRDINDNSPMFINLPRTVSFPEVYITMLRWYRGYFDKFCSPT